MSGSSLADVENRGACPDAAVIGGDLVCRGCGYNLRTLRVGGVCPECARRVRESIFVVPEPKRTASAIAYAIVCFAALLDAWTVLALLFAVWGAATAWYLRYRCGLRETQDLAGPANWFYRASVVRLIALVMALLASLLGDPAIPQFGYGQGSSLSLCRYGAEFRRMYELSDNGHPLPANGGMLRIITARPGETKVAVAANMVAGPRFQRLRPGESLELTALDGQSVKMEMLPNGLIDVAMASGYHRTFREGALGRMPGRGTVWRPTDVVLVGLLGVASMAMTVAVFAFCLLLGVWPTVPGTRRSVSGASPPVS